MKDRKVKVGVVGCGVVATAYYLPHLMGMENVELTAVCDVSEERIQHCQRLFWAKEIYSDYFEMLRQASIDAVFILTGPGTHASFTLAAVEAGKHVLLQKPMATNMKDAVAIRNAVREKQVVALIEPSDHSPLDWRFDEVRRLIDQGVLGDPYWFANIGRGGTKKGAMSGGNPYGVGAFFAKDSGGMLFDFPYAPTMIVSLLGDCRSVQGLAKISVPERYVVPDSEYDIFLGECSDPMDCNYWSVVMEKEKTQKTTMGAADNVYSLYEMANGWIGAFHIGRLFQQALPGVTYSSLEIYGTEGHVVLGTDQFASVCTTKEGLLPETDNNGWYHIPHPEGPPNPKGLPIPGAFNYYHASSDHFIDCILNGKDPMVNVEWGLHITEMMCGAIQSAETGQRYEMTTSTTGFLDSASD